MPPAQAVAARRGAVQKVGDFQIFIDDRYGDATKLALHSGLYEWRERALVQKFLRPTDRVIEIGTAIGLVAMTAAAIVGPQNVLSFDANALIIDDASENFLRNGLDGVRGEVGLLANRQSFRPGTFADFHVSNEFWASRLGAGGEPDIVETVSVPWRCLEDEICGFGANVVVCDIEGGEVELLSGANLAAIRLLILETHYGMRGEKAVDDMMGRLIASGFSLHLEDSGQGVSVLRRL